MTVQTTVKPSAGIEKACYHCGEDCGTVNIQIEDKSFCCEGCKTVYEILDSNGLCQYYQIDERPGWQLKGKSKAEYAHLDDEELQTQIIDFTDGRTTRVSFHIPQIHCASCIWLLEKLYQLSPGIESSKVNFLKKEVFIVYKNSETTLRKVVELLDSIGYAPSIQLKDLDKRKRPIVERKFFYKLGVAGFAFGNIMLLSFPEYLGLEGENDAVFIGLFGYLNLLLALPVLIFSGSDYLRAAWQGIRHWTLNIDVPIALGMLTLFGRSAYEIITHTGAGYMDSLAGLVFFLLIGKWFQQRTYHTISFDRDYKSYFPIAAHLKQGKKVISTALNKLKPGDEILVKNEELIPTDAILLSGNAKIDYSFVTGESEPIRVVPGEKVFAGGRQIGDEIELKLTKRVSQSYLTQLWNDSAFTKKQVTNASTLANRVGKYFTIVILLIAGTTLAYWLPKDLPLAVNAFTAVLIIACPCAVALAIPFIFGNVLGILGHNRLYLKNTNVIEAFNQVDSVVLDKTGTLTTREKSIIEFIGEPLDLIEKRLLLTMARISSHPASHAISNYLESHLVDYEPWQMEIKDWKEIPGKGIQGVIGHRNIKIGSSAFMGKLFQDSCKNDQGVYVMINNEIRGYFAIQQSLRPGIAKVFGYFKQLGKVHLISGDNDKEKAFLQAYLPAEQMHFRQSPHDKLAFVKEKQKSNTVFFLGDGLNDAGALKQSDLGVVLTENTNNFTPASDGILAAEEFERLPVFIRYAKKSVNLVYGAYLFAFVYNIIGLSFAVQGALSPVVAAILMPLSSISIVVYGILSSNWVAWRMDLIGKRE